MSDEWIAYVTISQPCDKWAQFPKAAITNCHRLGGLKYGDSFSDNSAGQMSKPMPLGWHHGVITDKSSLEALRGHAGLVTFGHITPGSSSPLQRGHSWHSHNKGWQEKSGLGRWLGEVSACQLRNPGSLEPMEKPPELLACPAGSVLTAGWRKPWDWLVSYTSHKYEFWVQWETLPQ